MRHHWVLQLIFVVCSAFLHADCKIERNPPCRPPVGQIDENEQEIASKHFHNDDSVDREIHQVMPDPRNDADNLTN